MLQWIPTIILLFAIIAQQISYYYQNKKIDDMKEHIEILNKNLQTAFNTINMLTDNQETLGDIVEAIRYEQATKH